MIEIKRCTDGDLQSVMDFLHEHWTKDHVLAKHRGLMDWQHADENHPGMYNWLIAVDEEGVQGVLGFIPTSKFDKVLSEKPLTWLALWKIRPESKNNGLGLQLLNTLAQSESMGIIAVQGINPKHPPMYKALGYFTGELAQYFVCHPNKTQSLLAVPEGFKLPVPSSGRATMEELNIKDLANIVLSPFEPKLPLKTPIYFVNRYFKHPVYTYKVFEVLLQEHAVAIVVIRIAESGAAKVLRIVDFLGSDQALSECGTAINQIMHENDCEYADFWQYGIAEETLAGSGFRRVNFAGNIIVPNFFEPFLQRNARIEFAIKGIKNEKLAIFRGDGDQDRPNRITSVVTNRSES
jgi:hypothetical protein